MFFGAAHISACTTGNVSLRFPRERILAQNLCKMFVYTPPFGVQPDAGHGRAKLAFGTYERMAELNPRKRRGLLLLPPLYDMTTLYNLGQGSKRSGRFQIAFVKSNYFYLNSFEYTYIKGALSVYIVTLFHTYMWKVFNPSTHILSMKAWEIWVCLQIFTN